MTRIVTLGLLALTVSACGPAAARLGPDVLGVSARDAQLEARTTAQGWDADARLRWVEGVDIPPAGVALPGAGHWRFHYTAPGRTAGFVVAIAAAETATQEGPPASPPGLALGDAALPTNWIDSPEAIRAALEARGGAAPGQASLLLVPGQPAQWVVAFPAVDARRWRVDARTGEVLGT